MLVKANRNIVGLRAGEVGEVDGNDPYIRASLRDGAIAKVSEREAEREAEARTAGGAPLASSKS